MNISKAVFKIMTELEQQEFAYQEQRIKRYLVEMNTVFDTILERETFSKVDEDVQTEFDLETEEYNDSFINLAETVYRICVAYIEGKGLDKYLILFKKVMKPHLEDRAKSLLWALDDESGVYYSTLVALFWDCLAPFKAFGDEGEAYLLKRAGLQYLEHILENTAVILKGLNITPTKEADVYNPIKVICKATFSNTTIAPSQSFQKIARCYVPDILIPSLNCAIEYKYAKDEQALISTIDQILADVQGYSSNPDYKIFYAVFYMKPAIWTKGRFDAVWEEKRFPKNWKGIIVEGEM